MKALVTAIIFSTMLSVAGTAKESFKAESANISPDIKKITVKGNTVVYLIQSEREQVTIEQGDLNDVSIKQVGNTLVISSDKKDAAIVTVYFKSIYRVDASNTSTVISVGKLTIDYLQVLLKDSATARIKADTRSLYTVTDGHSKLELIGTTQEHILQTNENSKLKFRNFLAQTTKRVQEAEMIAGKDISPSLFRISVR
jgi:hypothetical protein